MKDYKKTLSYSYLVSGTLFLASIILLARTTKVKLGITLFVVGILVNIITSIIFKKYQKKEESK